ncbi:hypothetical protein F2P79_004207 [Pimephales promelas]|nr:hypothetical protein F2P79_004207 [Pimephales promelas]
MLIQEHVVLAVVLYPDLTQNQELGCDYESQKTIQPAAFPEASIWTPTAICEDRLCTNAFHPHKCEHTVPWSYEIVMKMESRHHGPQPLRPTSQAMPLGWRHTNGCVTHGGSGRMLLHEMLWQLEQRALQVQEQEFQYCISRGIMGYRHAPAYPSLLALIPASEHRQLERLCGRIPPSHTAIVLSRLHDLLANNDIPPWELVGVFKQVLRDFLRRQEDAMQRLHLNIRDGRWCIRWLVV